MRIISVSWFVWTFEWKLISYHDTMYIILWKRKVNGYAEDEIHIRSQWIVLLRLLTIHGAIKERGISCYSGNRRVGWAESRTRWRPPRRARRGKFSISESQARTTPINLSRTQRFVCVLDAAFYEHWRVNPKIIPLFVGHLCNCSKYINISIHHRYTNAHDDKKIRDEYSDLKPMSLVAQYWRLI